MQEIRLTINTRDLRTLREKYLDNTYYTADVQWKGIRVRNAGVRSRGIPAGTTRWRSGSTPIANSPSGFSD